MSNSANTSQKYSCPSIVPYEDATNLSVGNDHLIYPGGGGRYGKPAGGTEAAECERDL